MNTQRGIEEIIEDDKKGKLFIKLHKKYYEKDAIFASAQTFIDRCSIYINPVAEDFVGVYFKKKTGVENDLHNLIYEFCNCLLDHQVRLDLEKKYGNIRELIVRHAFNPIKDIKNEIKRPEM